MSRTQSVQQRRECVEKLQRAFSENNLALYLGAGVSISSGIPSWEKLVSAMYFAALSEDSHQAAIRGAFRNYLLAIAEWHLHQNAEPFDITAEKIEAYYGHDSRLFRVALHDTLYMALRETEGESDADILEHLSKNKTLGAVADLCASPPAPAIGGVRAVVTYNYDDLLERVLAGRRVYRAVSSAAKERQARKKTKRRNLPIYHVHGFVPFGGRGGSPRRELVFTESQYHATANDPYHWSNLVQIKTMASHVGLMIGMSMTDRNVRRLLGALSKTPIKSEIYVILQTPEVTTLTESEVRDIRRSAKRHLKTFRKSAATQGFRELSGLKSTRSAMKSLRSTGGMKAMTREQRQVESILNAVKVQDIEVEVEILRNLGVIPIWIDDFVEIPAIVEKILN